MRYDRQLICGQKMLALGFEVCSSQATIEASRVTMTEHLKRRDRIRINDLGTLEVRQPDVMSTDVTMGTKAARVYSGMASSVSKWPLSQTTRRSTKRRLPASSRILSI
jgi:hypothetical protein